jgi:hypothetical protein
MVAAVDRKGAEIDHRAVAIGQEEAIPVAVDKVVGSFAQTPFLIIAFYSSAHSNKNL